MNRGVKITKWLPIGDTSLDCFTGSLHSICLNVVLFLLFLFFSLRFVLDLVALDALGLVALVLHT